MKTQCTAQTNDSVRMLIALRTGGELRLASREEVRAYMEQVLREHVRGLEDAIQRVASDLIASHESHKDAAGWTTHILPLSDTREDEQDE